MGKISVFADFNSAFWLAALLVSSLETAIRMIFYTTTRSARLIGKRDVALHFAILMSFPHLWRVFADLKFALWRDGVLAGSLDILIRIQIVMQVLGLRDPFFQSYAPLFNRIGKKL